MKNRIFGVIAVIVASATLLPMATAAPVSAFSGGSSSLSNSNPDCTNIWLSSNGRLSPTTQIYGDFDGQAVRIHRSFYWWDGSQWVQWKDPYGRPYTTQQAGTANRNGSVIFQGWNAELNHPSDYLVPTGYYWTEVDHVRSLSASGVWSYWYQIGAAGWCDFR